MTNYYICLNCGRIQFSNSNCEVGVCGGATVHLSEEEVEEYRKKRFKKNMNKLDSH